ncbi:hypothetical protein OBBRIDRAFT_387726 [Obba rivulosa]|uniref:Uncharacterized protein n=1 Tax=Obba rivulosa TaxID=1052685 RepID=A0A8E2B1F7_9APHY|nr:hypothetical protein OBBRIDRAFT_387726 [Obba rivulosa]
MYSPGICKRCGSPYTSQQMHWRRAHHKTCTVHFPVGDSFRAVSVARHDDGLFHCPQCPVSSDLAENLKLHVKFKCPVMGGSVAQLVESQLCPQTPSCQVAIENDVQFLDIRNPSDPDDLEMFEVDYKLEDEHDDSLEGGVPDDDKADFRPEVIPFLPDSPGVECARPSAQSSTDAAKDAQCSADAGLCAFQGPSPTVDEQRLAHRDSGGVSDSNSAPHDRIVSVTGPRAASMRIRAVSAAPQQPTPSCSTSCLSPARPSPVPILALDVPRPVPSTQPKVEVIDLTEETQFPSLTMACLLSSPTSAHSADVISFLRSLEVPLEHFAGAFESMGFKTDAHLFLLSRTHVMWDLVMAKLQTEYGATMLDCVSIADGLNRRRSGQMIA